ncbi:S-adenosyl-L-methionine-dependent methyltransferase [Sporodiniella umbellata]|nr:S-adenosyl-L-methionine-dependent methyltransferase [Sporodiniella umbellata]
MQGSKSVDENKTKPSKSWFHKPLTTLFSNSPEKRPNTLIDDLPLLRPKIYRAFSKVARKQSKASSVETMVVVEREAADEEEADRIQLKNDLVKLAFEGEFSLPFDYKDLTSGRILDVGCGPGAWCIDLAQKYPHLQVFGVDHVDMFPLASTLPENCHLWVSNVLQGLSEFPDASFDVIHIRFMILALTTPQYLQVARDCWRLLKPGAYLEILETDLTVYSAGPLTQSMNRERN